MSGTTTGRCQSCGSERPVWELVKCHSCGRVSCRACATFAYGRYFCSSRCAQYFFHGDADADDEKPDDA